MILSARDPASMTTEERLLELSELLGTAYLRLLLARKESQKGLDQPLESEPSCALVNGAEIAPGKEPT